MTRLLTIREVSERTRVPVDTLRYWRHLGTGPESAKLGRRIVYRESDVDAFVAAQFAGARRDVMLDSRRHDDRPVPAA